MASDLDPRMASVAEGESAGVNPGGGDPGLYSQQSLSPAHPDWPREHGLLGFQHLFSRRLEGADRLVAYTPDCVIAEGFTEPSFFLP